MSEARDPRVCIVGAGNLSSSKIYPYIGLAGGELVGVCDLDQAKAQRNARRFGGEPFADLDTMLDKVKPDGVIICIGPRAHAELGMHVMQRGYPVYTEKPPAVTAADALAVARVAKQTGMLCTTAFKKRYAQVYQDARQWIDGFTPQQRLSLGMTRGSASYQNKMNHYGGIGDHRPALLDFEVHAVDLMAYLFGDVKRVFCFARGDRAYAVSLEYACGAVGTLNYCDGRSFHVPTEEVEITIDGGNWLTIHNSCQWRLVRNGQPAGWREPPMFASSGDSGRDTGHGTELAEFVRVLREGGTTRSNIFESYKSMVLLEAIATAADSGAVVDVHYEEV
ncbi:MAG: Gfo/Idh/MocA family oxidoreductase [Phycisphaeraceae bacterium]